MQRVKPNGRKADDESGSELLGYVDLNLLELG